MRYSIDSIYSTYRCIEHIGLFFDIAAEHHQRVKLVQYDGDKWRLLAGEHKDSCPRNLWRIMTSCRTKKYLLKALLAHGFHSQDKEHFTFHEDTPPNEEKKGPNPFVSFKAARPMEGQHIEVKTFSGLTMEAIYRRYLDLEGVCDSWRPFY